MHRSTSAPGRRQQIAVKSPIRLLSKWREREQISTGWRLRTDGLRGRRGKSQEPASAPALAPGAKAGGERGAAAGPSTGKSIMNRTGGHTVLLLLSFIHPTKVSEYCKIQTARVSISVAVSCFSQLHWAPGRRTFFFLIFVCYLLLHHVPKVFKVIAPWIVLILISGNALHNISHIFDGQ